MMKWRRRMLRRKTDPKTGKRTVCEPLQSKCTRTFHKSHCVRGNLQGKWPRTPPQPAFCASLRSRNSHGHITRSILCGLDRENAGCASRGKHFGRACAVDMHMGMSQEAFCAEIYKATARETRPAISCPAGRPVCVEFGQPAS